ncbi:MAG: CoA transferase [Polaromonas sp.]|nr:CoA transferase [Polaromonas sp.]
MTTPPPATTPSSSRKLLRPLKRIRVLSLALNLPGPAALMRLRDMGATCVKLEPPSGDPMLHYSLAAYEPLHAGVKVLKADLKTDAGQAVLHRELAKADVLLTSFRPSALQKLGLDWKKLHRLYPGLSQVAIVGSPGERAEEPGHDLTYLADTGLVPGFELPATLYADMSGSLLASEAVLQALLARQGTGKGSFAEVALSDAAAYLALPRQWGLTQAGGMVGGAHAGYGIYACKDGRVALAALEPHFARSLCAAAGLEDASGKALLTAKGRDAIAAFLLTQTRAQLDRLAAARDIPLHTMKKAAARDSRPART